MNKIMLKSLVTYSMMMFVFSNVFSQNYSFVNSIEGTGNEIALSTAIDDEGNTFITGGFEGTVTIDAFVLNSNGDKDVYVAKIDTNGNALWAISFGNTLQNEGRGIVVDSDGNCYVTGLFDGGSMMVQSINIINAGWGDIFLAKFDTDGNCVWALSEGGSSYDDPWGMDIDAQNNLYVGGNYRTTALFGNSDTSLTAVGSNEIFLAKYDTSGTLQWVRSAGGSSLDYAIDVDCNSLGFCAIAGNMMSSNADFSGINLSTFGDRDYFTALYDKNGDIMWAKSGGSTAQDRAFGVTIDEDNNVYTVGKISGNASFGSFNLSNSGDDAALVKYNSSGVEQWAVKYGGTGDDYGWDVKADMNGDIYVTGSFEGINASFDTINASSSGAGDIFLHRIDPNGNIEWFRQFGNAGEDIGREIYLRYNYIVLTGLFQGNVTFEGDLLSGDGSDDVYVLRYYTNCNNITADANSDQTICALDSCAMLNGSISDGSGGLWSTTGSGTFSPDAMTKNATYCPAASDTVGGSIDLILETTDGGCLPDRDTMTLFFEQPSAVDLGNDTTLCAGDDTLMLDAFVTGATYDWSTGESSSSIEVTTADTYAVEVTESFCVVTDTIIVSFDTPPTVDLGIDTTICQDDTLTLDAFVAGATYNWSTGATTSSIDVTTPIQPQCVKAYYPFNGNANDTTSNNFDGTVFGGATLTTDRFGNPNSAYYFDGIDDYIDLNSAMLPTDGSDWSFECWLLSDVSDNVQRSYLSQYVSGPTGRLHFGETNDSLWYYSSNFGGGGPGMIAPMGNDWVKVSVVCSNGRVDFYVDCILVSSSVAIDDVLNIDTYIGWGNHPGRWFKGKIDDVVFYDCAISVPCPAYDDTYTVKVTSGVCVRSDTIDVSVQTPPVVDLGNDTTLCAGDDTLTLDAFVTGATYDWSTGATTSSIEVTTANTYAVEVTESFCVVTDTIIVNFDTPPVVDLGNDTTICDGEVLNLDAFNAGATYDWSTGSTQSNIDVTTVNTYAVEVTSGVCIRTDTIDVSVQVPPVVDLGNDTTLCAGDDTLTLDAFVTGATYDWSTGATTSSIEVTTANTYALEVTESFCVVTDTIIVNFDTPPVVDLGNDTTICDGQLLNLDAFIAGATYDWSTGSTQSDIDVTTANTYAVEVTSGACERQDTIIVGIFTLPTVDAGLDTTINQGESVQLSGCCANVQTIWTPNTAIDDNTILNPTVDPSTTTAYTLTITDANGCSDNDAVMVTVNENLSVFVPNSFSPNGDNSNDVFKVYGIGIKTLHLSVYNKWGNRVYSSDNVNEILNQGWDGSYNGTAQPTGTYVWKLSGEFVSGEEIVLAGENSGTLLLIR